MEQNKRDLIRYLVLLLLIGIGVWEILDGNTSFGSGLLASAVIVFIITTMKQRGVRRAQEQGMNPLDERTWAVAGKAAYASYVVYALVLGLIILLGSILGPDIKVNPYNLLGFCLSGIVLLYVGFYYYYNNRF